MEGDILVLKKTPGDCLGYISWANEIATKNTSFKPPNGSLVREMGPLISGKSRLVKYYSIWPDIRGDKLPNYMGIMS